MNPTNYLKNVLVTEARDFSPLQERFQKIRSIRLLHGAIGLASELAEIRDMAQKQKIDEINLKEEMGDLCWYMGIMISELELDPEDIFRSQGTMVYLNDPEGQKIYLNEYIDNMTIDIGDMIDLLKKHLMYGKELNVKGVKQKLLSLSCAIEFALNIFSMTSGEARERNIEKLRARYGEKFTEAAANERNLVVEREILEKK